MIISDKLLTRLEAISTKDLKYVFVVAPGRSGSTLVQATLNSIPGWKILGENAGALQGVISSLNATLKAHTHAAIPLGENHPWFGAHEVSTEEYSASIASSFTRRVLRPDASTRATGFKEIRWAWDDLTKNLRDTQRIFPNARFVLNVRNPEEIVKSGWWKESEDAFDTVSKIVSAIENTAIALPEETFLLRYEEYTSDPTSLKILFDWLGEEWNEARIREILAHRLTH